MQVGVLHSVTEITKDIVSVVWLREGNWPYSLGERFSQIHDFVQVTEEEIILHVLSLLIMKKDIYFWNKTNYACVYFVYRNFSSEQLNENIEIGQTQITRCHYLNSCHRSRDCNINRSQIYCREIFLSVAINFTCKSEQYDLNWFLVSTHAVCERLSVIQGFPEYGKIFAHFAKNTNSRVVKNMPPLPTKWKVSQNLGVL